MPVLGQSSDMQWYLPVRETDVEQALELTAAGGPARLTGGPLGCLSRRAHVRRLRRARPSGAPPPPDTTPSGPSEVGVL